MFSYLGGSDMSRIIFAFLFALVIAPAALAQSRGAEFDPANLDRLAFMLGTFEVTSEESNPQGEWAPRPTHRITMERDLYDAIMVENRRLPEGDDGISTMTVFGYDPFREEYRVVVNGSFLGLVDVFEGTFDGGRLVLDNVSSGTSYHAPNGAVYNYQLWFEDTEGPGYARGINISWDGGETFYPWVRGVATPVED